MSTSIRPPAGSPAGSAGVGEASEVSAGAEVSASEAAAPGEAARASEASRTASADSVSAQWLERLEAREISRTEAIEGLVAQALEAHGGARLPAAQRTELEGLLRSALLEDPVLGRLLGGG